MSAEPILATHGYQQETEITGRPISELIYALALAITVGADVTVFYQVVSIAMPSLSSRMVWLTVAGFTAMSLALAHFAGRVFRDRAAGHGPVSRLTMWLLVTPWALLGVIAFTVRLIVASSTTSSTAVGASSSTPQDASAIMFLALYVASGAVAGFGEYLTRNPFRQGYRSALRKYRKSERRLGRSQPKYEHAVNVLQMHIRSRQREAANFTAAKSLQLAFADELKRYAAVLIAAHLQHPSATDGMTLPDRVPFPLPKADADETGGGPGPSDGGPGPSDADYSDNETT
jgi:hypothetical protein